MPPDCSGFVSFGSATLRLTSLRRNNPLSTVTWIYTIYFILPISSFKRMHKQQKDGYYLVIGEIERKLSYEITRLKLL